MKPQSLLSWLYEVDHKDVLAWRLTYLLLTYAEHAIRGVF